MKPRRLHDWDLSTADARVVQLRLASRVDTRNRLAGRPRLIAGLDIPGVFSDGDALAAVVVLNIRGSRSSRSRLLGFVALEKLTVEPDLLVVDGHGQAQPRCLGIDSHLGVLLDIPAIGCGNSLLVGTHGAWVRSVPQRPR